MNKLKKTIKAIFEVLKNPWLLNKVLEADLVWENYIRKNYSPNYTLPVIEIDELIPDFKATLNYFASLEGGSLPTDIALLQNLAKRSENCTYFEIGTWRGESIANVEPYTKECYTLSLSKKELLELGFKEKYADLHGFFSKTNSKIIHLEGNSLTYDFSKLNKKFDVIFIDGDHHYSSVKKDTENVFKYLVHEKSIVVWHDYAYNPEKSRPEVFAAILDGTPKEKQSKLFHVSNTLCAIYINGKFNTHSLEEYTTPTKNFKLSIESEKIILK